MAVTHPVVVATTTRSTVSDRICVTGDPCPNAPPYPRATTSSILTNAHSTKWRPNDSVLHPADGQRQHRFGTQQRHKAPHRPPVCPYHDQARRCDLDVLGILLANDVKH